MSVTLPYPPSANAYWRTWKGRMLKSAAARAYQLRVQLEALAGGYVKPVTGPVAVQVTVYRPRRIGDLDNTLKVALDSLKGILFVDDEQVVDIHARRRDDASNPRLEIVVTEDACFKAL